MGLRLTLKTTVELKESLPGQEFSHSIDRDRAFDERHYPCAEKYS